MARQLHSKPMKMGLAPLPFSHSQAACLLLPTSLVVDEHAPRLGHACRFSARTFMLRFPLCCRRCRRCADPAALPKLPKLQNTSQLLTPPRIEADYSIKKMRRWHRVNLKPRGMSCLGSKDNVHIMKCPRKICRRWKMRCQSCSVPK